jgi:transcriptional regulator with XRE-family HTH domain
MDGEIENQIILKRVGARIRAIRSAALLSQEQLADVAGVHRTYIGMLERGEKNLTVLSAVKICQALNVSLSELFEGCDHGE